MYFGTVKLETGVKAYLRIDIFLLTFSLLWFFQKSINNSKSSIGKLYKKNFSAWAAQKPGKLWESEDRNIYICINERVIYRQVSDVESSGGGEYGKS